MSKLVPGQWAPPAGVPPGYYPPGVGMPFHGAPGPMTPASYDPEITYKNPTGSMPGPLAVENRGYWAYPRQQVNFDAAFGQDYVGQVGWGTPIFDLRPDLRASAGVEPAGQAIFRSAAFGSGARLHLKISGINVIPAGVTLRWFYRTFGDPVNPNNVDNEPLCQPQEFTSQFYNGGNAVVMTWTPDGGPLRYWKLEVFGRQYGVGNPFLSFTASLT